MVILYKKGLLEGVHMGGGMFRAMIDDWFSRGRSERSRPEKNA